MQASRVTVMAVAVVVGACGSAGTRAHSGPVQSSAPGLRLPTTVVPTAYAIELDVRPATPDFAGTVDVELDVRQAVDTVWLHASGLSIEQAELTQGARTLAATPTVVGEYLGLTLPETIATGRASLRLSFTGRLDDERTDGLYRVAEPDGTYYAYTKFEPLQARRAFPCFDEPQLKVPWTLSFVLSGEDVAVANAPVARDERLDDGRRRVTMMPTPPLPSYLVAFMVGPFDVIESGVVGQNEHPLRFVVAKGRTGRGELAYARSATPRIVAALEEFFGIPYPYAKLDVAIVPRGWGTMEHPGIVALGAPLTLIPPDDDSTARRQAYANIAIHELCHYWFGDLVTMAWWDDTWLNEGLGTWCDLHVTEMFEPGWSFDREFARQRTSAATQDAVLAPRRVREPVANASDIEAAFAGLTYQKGASVTRMFERWVGEARFRGAVASYLRGHAHGVVTSEDFYAAVDRARPGTGAALQSFVEQPGIPVVEMALECASDGRAAVHLSQAPYRAIGAPSRADTRWRVPVCVKYAAAGGMAEDCMLLEQASGTLSLDAGVCPARIVPNADGVGYYIAHVAGVVPDALAADAVLTPSERVVAFGDLLALVRAGRVSMFDVLEALSEATAAADEDLTHYVSLVTYAWWVAPEHRRDAVARYIRDAFGKRTRALGWEPAAGEPDTIERLRARLLWFVGVLGEDQELRAEAVRRTRRHLAGTERLHPSVRHTAMRLAAESNDVELFERFLERARTASDVAQRQSYYAVLGAFSAPTLAARSLALMLDDSIDLRDSRHVFGGQMAGERTRQRAYEFMKTNFDSLLARTTSTFQKSWVSATGYFCDQAHRDDVAAFFGPRVDRIEGGARALANTLESMDQCIARRAHLGPQVEAYFAARSKSVP